jgi:hypothetical protein
MQDESITPQFAPLPVAVRITGASRTRIYSLAPAMPGLLRKDGRSVLVDVAMLLARQRSLPPAKIRSRQERE